MKQIKIIPMLLATKIETFQFIYIIVTLKYLLGSLHVNKELLWFADYPSEKFNMTLNKNYEQSTPTEAILKKKKKNRGEKAFLQVFQRAPTFLL